jgi:hypothetical protein
MRRVLEAYTETYRPVAVWGFLARHALAFSVGILMIGVGATTAVAHRAAPDDALYGYRLAVNDGIERLFAGSEDARIDEELQQIDRALEDELLALDTTLSDLARGVPDEAVTEESNDEQYRVNQRNAVQFDDGADVELDALLRDLEDEVRETPDVGL